MKKTIILVFTLALFLIPIPNAFGLLNTSLGGISNPSSVCSDYIFAAGLMPDGSICNPLNGANWTTKTIGGSGTFSRSTTQVNITVPTSAGNANIDLLIRSGFTSSQVTVGDMCDFQFGTNLSNPTSATASFMLSSGDVTNNCGNGGSSDSICVGNAGVRISNGGWAGTFYPYSGNFSLNFTSTGQVDLYINNSDTGKVTASGTTISSGLYNITLASGGNIGTVTMSNVRCYNGTIGAPQQSIITPDTTPPSIIYFNLVNGSGCENWNTDKNNACSTSLIEPTVQFNTSENAWCAIGGSSSSSSLNLNYSNLGSNRRCNGPAEGDGTTSHYCTLSLQDELVYDTSYLFISCNDTSGNQNATSTSGPLKLSVTSLEANGRNSIGIGIQNALLSGYTNYTDQQIYARNLSNAQVVGTFDRVIKKGSKTWAFNRIGVSDSYVNMFNLTPVLYSLELANTTSSQITLLVESMINATK